MRRGGGGQDLGQRRPHRRQRGRAPAGARGAPPPPRDHRHRLERARVAEERRERPGEGVEHHRVGDRGPSARRSRASRRRAAARAAWGPRAATGCRAAPAGRGRACRRPGSRRRDGRRRATTARRERHRPRAARAVLGPVPRQHVERGRRATRRRAARGQRSRQRSSAAQAIDRRPRPPRAHAVKAPSPSATRRARQRERQQERDEEEKASARTPEASGGTAGRGAADLDPVDGDRAGCRRPRARKMRSAGRGPRRGQLAHAPAQRELDPAVHLAPSGRSTTPRRAGAKRARRMRAGRRPGRRRGAAPAGSRPPPSGTWSRRCRGGPSRSHRSRNPRAKGASPAPTFTNRGGGRARRRRRRARPDGPERGEGGTGRRPERGHARRYHPPPGAARRNLWTRRFPMVALAFCRRGVAAAIHRATRHGATRRTSSASTARSSGRT